MQEEQYLSQFNPDEMNSQSLAEVNLQILPTKANILALSERIAAIVTEGVADPLETIAKLEAIKGVCEESRKKLESFVRSEIEKYGKEPATKLGAKFELSETGVKYDYSNDAVWKGLVAQLVPIQEKIKEREKFLKTVTKAFAQTDTETGETIEVFPPTKTSNSSFKVTLGK